MKKILLSLIIIFTFISISLTLVKANNETTVKLVDGVQIRTDGNNGLKWVANVTNHKEGNEYGFLFAQGDVNDLTIETLDVIIQEVNGLSDNNSFCATMVKFPTSAVAKDITVRAYVKDGDTYTYSVTSVVRNLAEAALAVYDADPNKTFINNVVDYVDKNYKSLNVSCDGVISLSSSKYEANPLNLEKEFIKDWNALFGTNWTEFNYEEFNTSAIEGSNPITANADTNCSGTNVYTFFNTNSETSAKWRWLLEFFLAETSTGIHPKLQINAVLGNGEYVVYNGDTPISKLWMLKHLSRSLYNFFKAGSANINDWPSITFVDSSAYAEIGNYNNQIIASYPTLVKIGEELNFEELNKDGYTFDGYASSENDASTSIVVSNTNSALKPEFSLVNYSIKFMHGNEEITNLAINYNIEEYFHLPTHEITGYNFLGWYDNPEFNGTPIEMIEAGTTGNMVLYAKFEAKDYVEVNVSFDLNGGNYVYASHNELVKDFLKDASELIGTTLATPSDYHHNTNKVNIWKGTIESNSTFRAKWLWLVDYIYDTNPSLWKAGDALKAYENIKSGSNGGYIQYFVQNVALVLEGTNYAKAVETVDNGGYGWLKSVTSGGSTNYLFPSYMTCADFSSQTEGWWNKYFDNINTLKEPTTLPTPYKQNYEFVGWESSLDGSIIKEFPGYRVETDHITYTAQWKSILGDKTGSLLISKYNTSSNDYFDQTNKIYKSNTFINTYDAYFGAYYSYRVYIGIDSETGLQKVLRIKLSGENGDLPSNATYCIYLPEEYSGSYDDNFKISNIEVGDIVLFDKEVSSTSPSNLLTVTFYKSSVEDDDDSGDNNINNDGNDNNENTGDNENNDNNEVNASVTFNYDGGVTEELYLSNGTSLGSLIVSKYNATDYWYSSNPYKNNIYVNTKSTTPGALFSNRIYIGKDSSTGLYKVIKIVLSGTSNSTWPEEAEVCITIANDYSGTYDDNFKVGNISVGNIILFDKAFTTASTTNLVTFTFYSSTISNDEKTKTITTDFVMPTPTKLGCSFIGWYDSNGNLYDEVSDFQDLTNVSLTAKWKYDDVIIGSFATNSWVEVNDNIQLTYEFASGVNMPVTWESRTPNIAEVDQSGLVNGLSEGVATIIVYVTSDKTVSFTYYVTVVTDATGMLKVLLDSNNEAIFTRYNLGIGSGTPEYYSDIIGSVSQLLFVDYVEHKDFYIAEPTKTYDLNGDPSTNGIDFVTFHYAADMPQGGTAYLTGGRNLAYYNYAADNVSFHYSTGMDGIYYCQNTAWGAWHAGSYRSMKWYATGVTKADIGTNIYTTDVTLGTDGYFYIKGAKTSVKNTTGYTTLNKVGLAVKLVGDEWYIGGCYYNSTYAFIASLGGNTNSIGIESSVRKLSDLWLTWQYSAQLCAKLLIQFNLPIQRLVPHHFFSGKDCPQPMLENEIEIWKVFVNMTEYQKLYYETYGSCGASPTLSTNSSYIDSKGRVSNLPAYSTCQTYTLTYKDGSTTKSITLSTIIPGSLA